ncbi:MAG TPA: PIG-L family deacetylase [Clostridia bacterium]|nr:PIG-L family deacetylase [Clostridia bacterium]
MRSGETMRDRRDRSTLHPSSSMAELDQLLGRTLVMVAHPDDECIACGALLQRIREPDVVFATDGAPRDRYFWKSYGSRETYAALREQEARRALAHVGVHQMEFLADAPELRGVLVDQELFRDLPEAFGRFSAVIERVRPDALLTLAYEGGHPDHDACSFLTSLLARDYDLPAWEAPLYHRVELAGKEHRHLGTQTFIGTSGGEIDLRLTPGELRRKRAMTAEYKTQGDFLQVFDIAREVFRPQIEYDYSKPPHEGRLNYEAWQWPMTGADVCASFADFLRAHGLRRRRHA